MLHDFLFLLGFNDFLTEDVETISGWASNSCTNHNLPCYNHCLDVEVNVVLVSRPVPNSKSMKGESIKAPRNLIMNCDVLIVVCI